MRRDSVREPRIQEGCRSVVRGPAWRGTGLPMNPADLRSSRVPGQTVKAPRRRLNNKGRMAARRGGPRKREAPSEITRELEGHVGAEPVQ
jgi:hypothetical protein